MKTLLLMRHAKSSWKVEGQPDHDRPLNERGKRDAPRMGRLLEEQGVRPDRILSSSAKRARKTAAALAEVLGCSECLEIRDDLYSAGPKDYINLLRKLPEDVGTAMVVGHDPTITELVSSLARQHLDMPTAAIARFELHIETWNDFIPPIEVTLRALWTPRELEG